MTGPGLTIFKEDLKGKIGWFITLRWVAVLGLLTVITVSRFLLGLPLPLLPLYLGNLLLAVYNGIFTLLNRRLRERLESPDWLRRVLRLTHEQISLDLVLLIYLIYFSGGIENPFIFYFIFHMIISSILLTNRSAYLQATLAVLLFGGVMGGVSLGWLPHYPITGFGPYGAARPPLDAFLARYLALTTTLYIAVYLTTTIVNQLRQREQELEVSNRLLGEQDRLKSRYVMTVSHDIQASLSAIASCLQTVISGVAGRVSGTSMEMVQRAYRRSQELQSFVRDLLDVSRMRAEREIEKNPVRLDGAVEKALGLFRAQVEEKGIHLVVDNPDPGLEVLANPTFLEQLLANLIGNAVRYTPQGGRIEVRLGPGESPELARVCVRDTGIGIAEQDLPRIFEDFFRAGNARGFASNGTGLGLAISRRIVEMHGGRIQVESRLDMGTAVSFTIPVHPRTCQSSGRTS